MNSNLIVYCLVLVNCFSAFLSTSSTDLKPSASIPLSRTINSFSCPQQFGYYPDSTDCSKYYVCSFGLALHKNCTNGLYFSIQLQNCDWPLNVLCENDYKSDNNPDSGYTVVGDKSNKESEEAVIQIKPLINSNNKPKNQNSRPKPTLNIDTYVPESSSSPVTEAYNLPNNDYTVGSHSEATGLKPEIKVYYNVENFNNTDSRNNYNLDTIYQPLLSTPAPTINVDGFEVPQTQTLRSSEQNVNYETTQPPLSRSINNNFKPTVPPQTQSNPSISNSRNGYTTGDRLTDHENSDTNNHKNSNNRQPNDGVVSNVRIDSNREANYYHYEDVGSSPISFNTRERNNYDLPPIEKPFNGNRNELIERNNGNNRNNNDNNNNPINHNNNNLINQNNDYMTTSSNRLMNPTQYYRQLYSVDSNTKTTTPTPNRIGVENQLRSTIIRPQYEHPGIQSTNEKPSNHSDNIYVFVKPLKDNRLLERLTRLRNSESRPQMSENPYNLPIRTIAPNVVRVIRKQKPKEVINHDRDVELGADMLVTTPKTTTVSPSVYQKQRLGQQQFFKQQNRSPRIIDRFPETAIPVNQRDNNRPEVKPDINSEREANRQTFVSNSNQRLVNRELVPENPFKEPKGPQPPSNYDQSESFRPELIAREPRRPQLVPIPNHREVVRPELVPNKPELPQNLNHRALIRPESVQNYNPKSESVQNQRLNSRQESQPNHNLREVIRPELTAEKPPIIRNNKPIINSYEPEVIPPYELEVANREYTSRVDIIPLNMKDVTRDAVVIDYSEINNRDRSYLDFLGFANSPKINPNSVRIIEMPLTTKKPSLHYGWNSNYVNNNYRQQVAKNDTIPHNLRSRLEDAANNFVIQTPKPPLYREEGSGRTPDVYKPTFRPDVRPSPGFTGDPRLRPSRPTTTEQPTTTHKAVTRPQPLPTVRQQPPLAAPPLRQSPNIALNKVEVVTTRPTTIAATPAPRNQRLKTYQPLITIDDHDGIPLGRSVQSGQSGNQVLNDNLPRIQTNIRDINDLRKNLTQIKPKSNSYNENHLSLTSRNEISPTYTTPKPIYITRKTFRHSSSIQKPTSTTTTTTTSTTTAAPTTTLNPAYDYYYEDITEDKNSVTLPSTRRTTISSRFQYRYKTTTTPKPYIEYEYEYDDYNGSNNSIPETSRTIVTTTVRAIPTTTTTTTTTTQKPVTRPSVYSTGRKPRPTNRRLVIKDHTREPPKPASRPKPIHPTPRALSTAQKCDAKKCKLPDCRCGGSDIPLGLSSKNIPQVVLITFDDAVNDLNWEIYEDIFEGRFNPNGCPIRGTFYVSHEWTDYGQVQTLYSRGHEIASHGVTHSFGEKFSKQEWIKEVNGQREIIHLYGGVKLEDIRGMRAPFLQTGGNRMFEMLYETNFTYDSSLPVFENSPPFWPYTLDYALNHECMIPPCPTKSFPGVWEVGMIMWQDLRGGRCSMGDACTNPSDEIGVYDMLLKNFNRHYKSNRAPFNLYYHSAWFNTPHHKKGFIKFLDEIIQKDDVYFITNWQMIQWMRNPTVLDKILDFEPWKCSQNKDYTPCNHPTVCNVNSKNGARSLRTCQPCPSTYPWVGNTGFSSSKYG